MKYMLLVDQKTDLNVHFQTNHISFRQWDSDHNIIMLSMQQVNSVNYWYPCLFWICFLDSLLTQGDHSSIHCFYNVSLAASLQPRGPEYDIKLTPTPMQGFHKYAQCYPQQMSHDVGALFVAIALEVCEHFHN